MVDEDAPDEMKTIEKIGTTVVFEVSHSYQSGGGSSGIGVGTPVDGGGVVTAVTRTTVPVEFPEGPPKGPVRLPGSETTVVGKTGSTDPSPTGGLPWGGEDDIEAAGGLGISAGEEVELADTLHWRYPLPCPGSRSRSRRLLVTTSEGVEPMRRVFNVANSGSCPCTIFIASFTGSGRIIDNVEIKPGEVLPVFEAPPEAAVVAVACSIGCRFEGCSGEVTISVPVV
jgi:hypothetical protein